MATAVLVCPLAPAPTGNGLAMRAGMVLEALAATGPVDVVVVPVAGSADLGPWAAALARRVLVVDPPTDAEGQRHVVAQLGDPELRRRLTAAAPLPGRARLAPPTLAADVAARLGGDAAGAAVYVLREYLVPFGAELARHLGAARLAVDLDDDVVQLLRDLEDSEEAEATERLLAAWLDRADVVSVAAPGDAGPVAARHGLAEVAVLPNVARPPSAPPPGPPGADRLLFLGNLTYGPNVEAATVLAGAVLPALRRRRPAASVAIVGAAPPEVLALAGRGVEVPGAVVDVAPWYADADVVVVPLRHGSGTRIKVLEAFAHRRPVVATPAAVAGLPVRDGVEVLLATDPEELAAAVAAILEDPGRAAALVDAAEALQRDRYAPTAVAPAVRRIVLGNVEGTP